MSLSGFDPQPKRPADRRIGRARDGRVPALTVLVLTAGLAALTAGLPVDAPGQSAVDVLTVRPSRAVRQTLFRSLRTARRCTQAADYACAAAALDEARAYDDLNSYERAQVWNVEAALRAAEGDEPAAVAAYERMLAEPDVPTGLVRIGRYRLAALYTSAKNYDAAYDMLEQWWADLTPEPPGPFVLRAQIQYQRGAYAAALEAIGVAIDSVDTADAADAAVEGGPTAEAAWYELRAAAQFELGELAAAATTLRLLVDRWPQRAYYVQLAGLYARLGDQDRRRRVYEEAYAQGWLDHGVDLITLAGFRLDAGRLQAALNVLEQNLDRGYMPDGESLRVLISRVRTWRDGESVDPAERANLLRNARLEQQRAAAGRRIHL